ncbi:MAG: hypothetical protein M3P18_06860, partial [Actinomycetota bacterium]|nr:hypothetical protein [Actinomycetota bacterium]
MRTDVGEYAHAQRLLFRCRTAATSVVACALRAGAGRRAESEAARPVLALLSSPVLAYEDSSACLVRAVTVD